MPRKRTFYQQQYGRRIALARDDAALTQTELGDLVGLSRSSIANIETGRQASTAEQVLILARELNCDPRWLLTGWAHDRPAVGRELPAPYQPVTII